MTNKAYDTRVEVAYRDLRFDPPKTKRVVLSSQVAFGRWIDKNDENVEVIATSDYPISARCESGWTGDRCTFPLFHDGPHSNKEIQ